MTRGPGGRAVVFVNPESGAGAATGALAATFPECRVEECAPGRLTEQVRALRDSGAPFVGVAGGDGTLRAAAEALRGGEVPLLAVPAGTRNHFAKEFGIATLADAAEAARAGDARAVDLGRVNDRVFLNNSSLGAYPRMVERREEHESRWPKWLANIIAAWQQLRFGRRLRVVVDGEPFVAWLVFVGNGRYGENLRDVLGRDALDENVLDVRIVLADRAVARLRLFAAMLFGRFRATPVVIRRECRRVRIDVPRCRTMPVALDGEVVQLSTPLDYESDAGALRVVTRSPE